MRTFPEVLVHSSDLQDIANRVRDIDEDEVDKCILNELADEIQDLGTDFDGPGRNDDIEYVLEEHCVKVLMNGQSVFEYYCEKPGRAAARLCILSIDYDCSVWVDWVTGRAKCNATDMFTRITQKGCEQYHPVGESSNG